MALVVATWRAIAAIVLALATYALAATFSFLLRGFITESRIITVYHTTTHVMTTSVGRTRHSGHLTRTFRSRHTVFRFDGTGSYFPSFFLATVNANRLNGLLLLLLLWGYIVQHRGHWVLEVSVVQLRIRLWFDHRQNRRPVVLKGGITPKQVDVPLVYDLLLQHGSLSGLLNR